MSLGFPYNGKFYAEQDTLYKEEQCRVTDVWSSTKRVLLNSWTIYEWVGQPAYQTPRFFCKNEAEARAKLSTL